MDQPRRARIVGVLLTLSMAAVTAIICFGVLSISMPASALAAQPPPDSACIGCHGDRTDEIILPSGEALPLGVDLHALDQSVHGLHADEDVQCNDCHHDRDRYRFPHQPNPAKTAAEFSAEVAENCQRCHEPIELHNPGHLMAESSVGLPTCTDCHGGHIIEPVKEYAADSTALCLSCHETYDDPDVERVHKELAANFGSDQSCQTCHNDQHVYPADAKCKSCHTLMEGEITLTSGEPVGLHVDLAELDESVHGYHQIEDLQYTPLLCTDCHSDPEQYAFPHPELDVNNLREMRFEMHQVCENCHDDIDALQHDSVHGRALADGNLDAPTCVDCHGNHTIEAPGEPREKTSVTCGQCHSTINEQYANSVHGAALLGEHNPDVPVCTDCHGVHNIPDPRTAEFRTASPQMCGDCHADEELMTQYDISTEVFDTYVADFHGTTVELFDRQSPHEETNKAVCYDCHGIHNILPANDEHSQIIQDNLLTTCRQCHPDATANFPAAWTSHFQPSLEHNPLVYLVNLFYWLVIPFTIGGFLLFIGSDLYRIGRERRQAKREDEESHE